MQYKHDILFNLVVPHVLDNLPGYRCPKSTGPQNYGLLYSEHEGLLRRLGVVDMKHLTPEQAKEILYQHYWRKAVGEIADSRLAFAVMEAALMLGVPKAKRILARLFNQYDVLVLESMDGLYLALRYLILVKGEILVSVCKRGERSVDWIRLLRIMDLFDLCLNLPATPHSLPQEGGSFYPVGS